ncbi:MAG TPA: hypothetical protein VK536_06570 [Candidatus Limnocylindrales bacterium]|nr:hypothetical protein [Candidatus Limnocylindrales bacterium]
MYIDRRALADTQASEKMSCAKERQEDLMVKAKKRWGVTDNIDKAGFMLTDGSLLDLTHDRPWMLNHEEAAENVTGLAAMSKRPPSAGLTLQSEGITKLLSAGAIRLHMSLGGGDSLTIQLNEKAVVTGEQWQALEKIFEDKPTLQRIFVDVTNDNNNIEWYDEIEGADSIEKFRQKWEDFKQAGNIPMMSGKRSGI